MKNKDKNDEKKNGSFVSQNYTSFTKLNSDPKFIIL